MDESTLMRFIFVGAGVFISLVTISAVLAYYTTSKSSIEFTMERNKIDINYNAEIDMLLSKEIVEGYELKNIIQHYLDDKKVIIQLVEYYAFVNVGGNDPNDLYDFKRIDLQDIYKINDSNLDEYEDIIKNMLPNQRFEVNKLDDTGRVDIYQFILD